MRASGGGGGAGAAADAGRRQGFGFVEFRSEQDAEYAVKVLNMTRLFGKPIRVSKSQQDGKPMDVGANLFIGNLAPEVDEKTLYDTFSAFGGIVSAPRVRPHQLLARRAVACAR